MHSEKEETPTVSYMEEAVEAAFRDTYAPGAENVEDWETVADYEGTREDIRRSLKAAEPYIRNDDRARVLGEVREALTDLDAHRAVARAAMREIKSNPTFRHEEEWAIFTSVVEDRLATLTPSEGSGAPLPEGETVERAPVLEAMQIVRGMKSIGPTELTRLRELLSAALFTAGNPDA